MSSEGKDALRKLISMVVASLNSDQLKEVIDKTLNFGRTKEGINGDFCDRYELGDWFYESLLRNDVDLIEELELILIEKKLSESSDDEMREAAEEVIWQAKMFGH